MAEVILPNGKQQFIDINGKPLVGGTVGMYVPATLIPKDTWQDSGGTILNQNPVPLDSRGQAQIYGDGTYRQIVKDEAGNLIWDVTINAGIVASAFGLQLITAVNDTAALALLTANGLSVQDTLGTAPRTDAQFLISNRSGTGHALGVIYQTQNPGRISGASGQEEASLLFELNDTSGHAQHGGSSSSVWGLDASSATGYPIYRIETPFNGGANEEVDIQVAGGHGINIWPVNATDVDVGYHKMAINGDLGIGGHPGVKAAGAGNFLRISGYGETLNLDNTAASPTDIVRMRITNGSGDASVGLEGAAGGVNISGSSPYAMTINTVNATKLQFGTQALLALSIDTAQILNFASPGIAANGSVATILGSLGPSGAHTTVQFWVRIKDASGNVGFMPAF